MRLSLDHLSAIAGGSMTADRRSNMQSIIAGLAAMGARVGLDRPQRLTHYLAQLGHESGRFVYDQEVWGPTAAQRRYDTRTDLGNTPEKDGDGEKHKGYGPMQVTGGHNQREYRDWCWGQGLKAPDFFEIPSLINTDPWEGISAIWYWSTRNLNRYADENNIEMVTRRINGGLNGFADRNTMYERTALVFLGYDLDAGAVKRFQAASGLIADDIVGPATRAEFHEALGELPTFTFGDVPAKDPEPVELAPSPVPVLPVPAKPEAPMTFDQYLTIAETAIAGLREHYGVAA